MPGEKNTEDAFSDENMFNADTEDTFVIPEDDDDVEDYSGFDGVTPYTEEEEEEEEDDDAGGQGGEEEEEEEEEEDDFRFAAEEEEEEEEEEDAEFNIEEFNKKFNTKFTKQEELKDFFKEKTEASTIDEEQKLFEDATNHINFLKPIIALDDEALMTKQFTIKAVQDKLDVNDEDVIADINSQVEEMIDKGTLGLEAKVLRKDLSEIIGKREGEVNKIVSKREAAETAEKENYKKDLESTFVKLYGEGNFYGIDVDKKVFGKVYQKVISGEFEKSLENKEIVAELALMNELKEDLFKNATGLTYNDGIGSILDEFKNKKKDTPIVKAQKRGSSAKTNKTEGLISDLMFVAPDPKKDD